MEGVDSVVMVVDYNVHNVVGGHDEWIDITVDDGIDIIFSCGGRGVQGRDFLWNVGLLVDTSPERSSADSNTDLSAWHEYLPIDTVGIRAEVEVHCEGLDHRPERISVIIRSEA